MAARARRLEVNIIQLADAERARTTLACAAQKFSPAANVQSEHTSAGRASRELLVGEAASVADHAFALEVHFAAQTRTERAQRALALREQAVEQPQEVCRSRLPRTSGTPFAAR